VRNLEVDFTFDAVAEKGPLVALPTNPEPKPEPRTEDKRKVTRAEIVGVWRHKPGNNPPGEITLHPNGKINDPNGNDTWTLTGRTLVLRWANNKALGGFWIDFCAVLENGETFRSVNQKGLVITGEKVKDIK
jgi:hypothetical protein